VLAALPHLLTDPNRPNRLPPTIAVERYDAFFAAADVGMHYPTTTPNERALFGRLWPNGIAMHLSESAYPVWVPAHAFAGHLLARHSPLAFFMPVSGTTVDAAALGEHGVVLTGTTTTPQPLTHLWVRDRAWEVCRPGALTETAIRERFARRIVFVCTGNTCRSPMAEAVFKHTLAERLGCTVADLLAHGYAIRSAGVATSDGNPASAEAVAVLRDWRIDLAGHRSQVARAEMIAAADDVICMTRNHLLTIVSRYPVLPGSMRLLCGADGDLDDPIGGSDAVYRACATKVREHVERLITEMGLS
jgi:protein-tyrosine phosphatase